MNGRLEHKIKNEEWIANNLKELPLDDTIDCTTKPSEYSLRVWNLLKPPLFFFKNMNLYEYKWWNLQSDETLLSVDLKISHILKLTDHFCF